MTQVNSRRRDEAQQSAAEIESEIRRTRVELGLTLEALEHQLAPRQVIGKGVDMITQSLKAKNAIWIDVGEAVRANRIPLALTGVSIAWLIAANLGIDGDEIQGTATSTGTGGSDAKARGTDRNGVWVHQAAGAARGAARSVREAAGTAWERAGEFAGYAEPAIVPVRRAGRSFRAAVGQRPFLVGLAGLICGAAIAALLPSTKRERDWAGEARGELWKKAEDIGHEAGDRVRNLADEKAGLGDV
jgi:hypothetical protein